MRLKLCLVLAYALHSINAYRHDRMPSLFQSNYQNNPVDEIDRFLADFTQGRARNKHDFLMLIDGCDTEGKVLPHQLNSVTSFIVPKAEALGYTKIRSIDATLEYNYYTFPRGVELTIFIQARAPEGHLSTIMATSIKFFKNNHPEIHLGYLALAKSLRGQKFARRFLTILTSLSSDPSLEITLDAKSDPADGAFGSYAWSRLGFWTHETALDPFMEWFERTYMNEYRQILGHDRAKLLLSNIISNLEEEKEIWPHVLSHTVLVDAKQKRRIGREYLMTKQKVPMLIRPNDFRDVRTRNFRSILRGKRIPGRQFLINRKSLWPRVAGSNIVV